MADLRTVSAVIGMSIWMASGIGAMHNNTAIIQLGIVGNTGTTAFSGTSGFWTSSLSPSHPNVGNALYRISLDTRYPFIILRQTRDIARVSKILLLSGHPILINSTLRLLGDTIQPMRVYQALTATASQFCRLHQPTNPNGQGPSLPYTIRSFSSQTQWTLLPLTCYHLSPLDPIVSLVFWMKWKSVIIISDHNTIALSDALPSYLYDHDIKVLHQHVNGNSSETQIKELLLFHYKRKERHTLNFILLCGWPLVDQIFKTVRKLDDEKFTAMFFYTKWITVCRLSQLPAYGELVNAMNNVLLVTLEAGLNPVILDDRYPWCEADAELWASLGPSRLSRLGHWSRRTGLTLSHTLFPDFGFKDQLFRVGVFEWQPFIMENLSSSENYTGFCVDIVRHLAEALNFSYTFLKARDGQSDALTENGTWQGIPRDIVEGVIDFSIAPFSITGEREKVLDFTYQFFTDYNVILTKRFTLENSWRLVIDIFSLPVIVVIVASVPATAFVIYSLEAWNPFPFPTNYQTRGVGRLGQLVWYTYGALLSQGGSHIPVSQAGRTQVAFWWLFSIMLTATFSGNLIAFLTVPKSYVPFQSLAGMVQQRQFTWGVSNASSFFTFLQTTNITPYDAVWRGVTHHDFHPRTHVDRVLSEEYAYLGDKSGCLYYLTDHCELTISKQEFFPLKYAIALPKGSPYNSIFSQKLSQMTEGGLIHKWQKDWWPTRNCSSKTTNAKKMTLGDVQSAFYLLITGIGLGLIAVVCEKIYSKVIARNSPELPAKVKGPQRNELTNNVLCRWFSTEVQSSAEPDWVCTDSNNRNLERGSVESVIVSETASVEKGLTLVKPPPQSLQ